MIIHSFLILKLTDCFIGNMRIKEKYIMLGLSLMMVFCSCEDDYYAIFPDDSYYFEVYDDYPNILLTNDSGYPLEDALFADIKFYNTNFDDYNSLSCNNCVFMKNSLGKYELKTPIPYSTGKNRVFITLTDKDGTELYVREDFDSFDWYPEIIGNISCGSIRIINVDIKDITSNSATVSYNVSDAGFEDIYYTAVAYDTIPFYNQNQARINDSIEWQGLGIKNHNLSELVASTTYYLLIYVIHESEVYRYYPQYEFTTLP